jgi:hypothetical protein
MPTPRQGASLGAAWLLALLGAAARHGLSALTVDGAVGPAGLVRRARDGRPELSPAGKILRSLNFTTQPIRMAGLTPSESRTVIYLVVTRPDEHDVFVANVGRRTEQVVVTLDGDPITLCPIDGNGVSSSRSGRPMAAPAEPRDVKPGEVMWGSQARPTPYDTAPGTRT